MSLTIRWGDVSGMKRMENALGRLSGHEKHLSLQRAVNHTGDKAKTQVIRALAKQTGLANKVIKRSVKVNRAFGASVSSFVPDESSLFYVMTTRGGDISLKYFKAREIRAGVTASPFGKRVLFAGSFIKGGRFPNRVAAKGLNGHVYRRIGEGRGPLELLNSGVIIPAEMLKGETVKTFFDVVDRDLPDRVTHEIERLIPGFFD
jgi:Prophage minor tail protein Z (GPZ)